MFSRVLDLVNPTTKNISWTSESKKPHHAAVLDIIRKNIFFGFIDFFYSHTDELVG